MIKYVLLSAKRRISSSTQAVYRRTNDQHEKEKGGKQIKGTDHTLSTKSRRDIPSSSGTNTIGKSCEISLLTSEWISLSL